MLPYPEILWVNKLKNNLYCAVCTSYKYADLSVDFNTKQGSLYFCPCSNVQTKQAMFSLYIQMCVFVNELTMLWQHNIHCYAN